MSEWIHIYYIRNLVSLIIEKIEVLKLLFPNNLQDQVSWKI